MSPERAKEVQNYFAANYEIVASHSFEGNKTNIGAVPDATGRSCRFCQLADGEVTFKTAAHAVPAFLGNKSIFSMDECDTCNRRFGQGCEDNLSKWSLLPRAAAKTPGRNGKPKFKDDGVLEVSSQDEVLNLHYHSKEPSKTVLAQGGPQKLELPADLKGQSYIPIEAAKALVKSACSVCPIDFLGECRETIQWLLGKSLYDFSYFPVLYSFTPGPINNSVGEIILLQRTSNIAAPYFWCIVYSGNMRFQIFVPLCPADSAWFYIGKNTTIEMMHYPTKFPLDWPFGKIQYGQMNWAGKVPDNKTASVTFHVEKAVQEEIE